MRSKVGACDLRNPKPESKVRSHLGNHLARFERSLIWSLPVVNSINQVFLLAIYSPSIKMGPKPGQKTVLITGCVSDPISTVTFVIFNTLY
jgi:hypothetical protein